MGEWEYLHITHPEVLIDQADRQGEGELRDIHLQRETTYLRPQWNTLYKKTLPALARDKDPIQPHWPVQLDHCFARIIYDAVIGSSRTPDSGIPWTERLEAPAVKNMHPDDMKQCIDLGEDIAAGRVDLVELDRLSLAVRGKQPKGGKRKRGESNEDPTRKGTAKKTKTLSSQSGLTSKNQLDIRIAMGAPPNPTPSQPPPAKIDPDLSSKINLHPSLTPFRKRVLLALCQVPKGEYTTYLAISNYLHSSPRAVGNALRNNPFAPTAPCHRVVAADGGIGGFGGEWGVQGKHNAEKVGLLREEGVVVGGNDSSVLGRVWEGFA